uniref:Chlorophyll synthase n=1 Tax=Heterosigma akashiwo TaxID=2829 RepID=A0A6V1M160_HETAK|mmetsp:Transcript_12532/g.17483  ORF Transcript_12532/g.17483 Transcript_12532/m.17483 type:complete len:397 (-) Transcript_12532:205-1395(-)|eukprot:CAMPEP_0194708256 /NCGR_PEP_ID=MMETSP0296-20130528/1193_1 /TAXON_ID=39354 /ORGANISM="Heterosigma akashiwo, Strain CCMP2393" /LENGTH=396 /DNA_ID=CAMNT_0039604957 /DNA_START=49 /DNA_END=1242 /DNA_ORIENTATION=+
MKLYIAAVLLLLNGASAFIFKSPSVKLSSTPMTMSMEKFDKSKTFFPFESSMPSSTQLMAKKDDSEEKDDRGDLKQLLGIRGASETDDVLRIRIQLTKPVTWIPLIWGVICGAAASGNYEWSNPLTVGMEGHVPLDKGLSDFAKVVTCMILAGPFLTGFTQTINDWYDREIDAINEPNRPIPSGKISEEEVIGQIWFLLLGGLGLAYGIDVWVGHDVPTVFLLSVFGSFISYIYSAPPLKLKQSWVGNYALGASYIALPWWCGQAAFGELTWDVVVLTVLYSLAGLGIAIVNDFKSIEGDRALGLQSLPVAFGVEKAKWICVSTIDVTQLAVAAYLYWSGQPTYGLVLLGLVLPQIALQAKYLIPDPINNDVKYQASAQPFLVFGILTTALAIGHR